MKFAFLSTYPPTECGLATFTQSQVEQLQTRSDVSVGVVSVVDQPLDGLPSFVVHQLVRGARGQARDAAAVLNRADVVVVQHEYGIFSGRDGADVLDLLAGVRSPIITVLHTILTDPTAHQHLIVQRLIRRSAALVTMTETGRERLLARWDVAPSQVHVIPHGAHPNEAVVGEKHPDAPKTVLTWGLIGPGKGIEWAIRAMVDVRDVGVNAVYRIVGRTHPRVQERDGEAYRDGLKALAEELGVSHMVQFDAAYHPGGELRRIVRSADLILLPYDSREQVTSGVLSEAIVAAKPVISTAFPHARELLSDGAGLLVPQGDARAIGQALVRALTDDALAESMARRSAELSGSQLWSAVMDQYVELAQTLFAVRRPHVA